MSDYEPVRCLRSSTQDLIRVERSRTFLSSRAFKHTAAKTLNNLRDSIRNCNKLNCTEFHKKPFKAFKEGPVFKQNNNAVQRETKDK